MKVKQNQTFFHGTYSNLISLFISHKILKYFQFHCKNEHKQVKGNKFKQGMCKADSIFPYL